MKVFESSRNGYITSLLGIVIVFLLCIGFIPTEEGDPSLLIAYAIFTPLSGILAWILLDTKYIFKQEFLHYYSGPFRGKIDIKSINRVETDNSFFKSTINKPALGRKGIFIFYNKYDEIYISPADKEGFLRELKKINPDIKIS